MGKLPCEPYQSNSSIGVSMRDKQVDHKKAQIASRIKSVREAYNLTATQLAEETGITPQRVYTLESHTRPPDVAFLIRLHERLGVSPNYILLGDCSQLPSTIRHLVP